MRVGGEGAVEFMEFGFDDLRDSKDFKVIVGGIVEDIPRSNEDSAEDLILVNYYNLLIKIECNS